MEKFPASHNSTKKSGVVEGIVDKLSRAQGVVFVDYRGLTVTEDNALRAKCRESDVEYHVLKNTMIKRACDQLGIEGLDETLNGPTAVAFGYDDPISAARVMDEFTLTNKKIVIKSGVIGKEVMDVDKVKAVAALKSRENVVMSLIGVMKMPIRKLVMTVKMASEKDAE